MCVYNNIGGSQALYICDIQASKYVSFGPRNYSAWWS